MQNINIDGIHIDVNNFVPYKNYRVTLANGNIYEIILDDNKNIYQMRSIKKDNSRTTNSSLTGTQKIGNISGKNVRITQKGPGPQTISNVGTDGNINISQTM